MSILMQRVCDIHEDEKRPAEIVVLGIDGKTYEADLCQPDRQDLKASIASVLSLLRPLKAPKNSHKKKSPEAAAVSQRTISEDDPRRLKGGDLPKLACRKCGAVYYGFQGRGAHERMCDGTQADPSSEFYCAECLRAFDNSMRFIIHNWEIHRIKADGVFYCSDPACNAVYRYEDKLEQHIQDRHTLEGAPA